MMVRSLPLAIQASALRSRFPKTTPRLKRDLLTWEANVRPTPLSRAYTLRLVLKRGFHPRTAIVDNLDIDWLKPPPHMYRDQSLCLYDAAEWNSSMLLVDTVVPWACEWLAHYELWASSGVWHGDSAQPAPLAQPTRVRMRQEGKRKIRRNYAHIQTGKGAELKDSPSG